MKNMKPVISLYVSTFLLLSFNALSQAYNVTINPITMGLASPTQVELSCQYSYGTHPSSTNQLYAVGVIWSTNPNDLNYYFGQKLNTCGEGWYCNGDGLCGDIGIAFPCWDCRTADNNYTSPTQFMKVNNIYTFRDLPNALSQTFVIGDEVPNGPGFPTAKLTPNTTYYMRAFIFYMYYDPGCGKTVTYSNTIQFKTPSTFAITNNTISNPLTICQNNVPQIIGSTPKSGNPNSITCQWQSSIDGGVTFNDIPNATGFSYTPTWPANITAPTQIWYQRIARCTNSANTIITSTSNATYYTYTPASTPGIVNITSVPGANLNLNATLIPTVSGSTTQWQQSGSVNGVFTNVSGNNTGATYTVMDNTQFFRAIITLSGMGCNSYTSPIIGISPKDGDNNLYPYVQIGNQNWMINNLTATKYNDGITAIPNVMTATTWTAATSSAFCWYNDNITYRNYGALYNNYVAINTTNNVCPIGWHVASKVDWDALVHTITQTNTAITLNNSVIRAGGILKTTDSWNPPNIGATTAYNFNALPGGYKGFQDGKCYYLGIYTRFWASDNSGSKGTDIAIDYNTDNFTEYSESKRYGLSIRCVKN